MNSLPWKNPALLNWSIVGMNHYHLKGKKYLFVSMSKNDRCVIEEGLDNSMLWKRLIKKIRRAETINGLVTKAVVIYKK